MKTSIKNLISVSAILLFFILGIASSPINNMTFTKEGGQIPPEFSQSDDTLLAINDASMFKFLTSNFKENYFGKFKIIKYNELENHPIEKYRYVFSHNVNYSTSVGGAPSSQSSDTFYVLDRKTNIQYRTKSHSSYSKLMRAYIKALEVERKK